MKILNQLLFIALMALGNYATTTTKTSEETYAQSASTAVTVAPKTKTGLPF